MTLQYKFVTFPIDDGRSKEEKILKLKQKHL